MKTSICTIGIFHNVKDAEQVQSEGTQKKMLLRSGTGGLTMGEYLDKEAFKKSVEDRYCKPCKAEKKDRNGCWCRACWVDDMLDEVECFKPSDVAPVVHGRWENGNPICPICGEDKFKDLDADIWCDWLPPFCPNCGAKMDGGNQNV